MNVILANKCVLIEICVPIQKVTIIVAVLMDTIKWENEDAVVG